MRFKGVSNYRGFRGLRGFVSTCELDLYPPRELLLQPCEPSNKSSAWEESPGSLSQLPCLKKKSDKKEPCLRYLQT